MDETLRPNVRPTLHAVRSMMEGSVVMDERSDAMEGVAQHG